MLKVLLAEQMKACDAYTINRIGIPSASLMERAAYACADAAAGYAGRSGYVVVAAGTGHNGGDGYACARILHLRGIRTAILAAGNPEHMAEETKRQAGICMRLGIPEADTTALSEADVIVDALIGIGLSRDVAGEKKDLIGKINESGARVVAVDVPSGVDADTGRICGCAVRADCTVTMQCLKAGLLLYPGAGCAGEVIRAGIDVAEEIPEAEPHRMYSTGKEDLSELLPERDPSGNKGTFGKVLVIAGTHNMAGAAILCGRAALRSGAGMVMILTPEINRTIIQSAFPEAMLKTWENAAERERALCEALAWCDAAACGPGLGTGEDSEQLVRRLCALSDKPMVLDADALNLISRHPELLKEIRQTAIITPHIGEMSRLTGLSVPDIKQDLIGCAVGFASSHDVICVLKDARTVTAFPDGRVFINRTGNSGMATAGSGDVLTGITASLLAQTGSAEKAAPAAVCLHGAAGDEAAGKEGVRFMTASDITDGLRSAMKAADTGREKVNSSERV